MFLDTLERRRLTRAPVGAGDWRFEVSPDGGTLAFIRYEREGIADLYIVPMRGGEPRRLSNWNAAVHGLSWTPDGREIVYSVEGPTAGRLWRIHSNSARPERGAPITDIPASADNPSISRSMPGQPARLAFQTVTRDVDIHLMDLAARAGRMTPSSRVPLRIPLALRARRDSRRTAAGLRSRRPARGPWRCGSLDAMAADFGSSRRSAPFNSSLARGPRTAQRIVFDATVAGNSDVYVIGSNGGRVRRLTSEPSIDGLSSWSVDGWIYFSSTRAGVIPDVWRISPAGGAARRMTRNGGFEPEESSDGRYLYYLDRYPQRLAINGTARLMRLPLAGGREEMVLERVRPFGWSVTDTGDHIRHAVSATSMRLTRTGSAISELPAWAG